MGDERQQAPPPPALVNMLQETFALLSRYSFAIGLPQVAVLGSQGSGKSRLLEALVGRHFLPDISTRRPLLVHLKRNRDSDEEYGEFLHIPERKFYDFNQIRTEIQAAETDREAAADKEIHLNIFSPNVVDITFVDLPGIPVGDDIEADRIRTMIMTYINNPSCLILAVTPATADITNSDAVQIALTADPDCNRTFGVITKVDLLMAKAMAEAEAEAKAKAKAIRSQEDVLLIQTIEAAGKRKVFPLRYGYVAVAIRRQEDIMLNLTIKDALAAEEDFFRNHLIYNHVADRCGVPLLAKRMDRILVQHSKNLLRLLKSRAIAASGSLAKIAR